MEVLVVMGSILLLLLILIAILAPLPGRIAKRCHHPHTKVIRLCGWTCILAGSISAWVLALMWAHDDSSEASQDFASQIAAIKKRG
jgi:hypothetical protein